MARRPGGPGPADRVARQQHASGQSGSAQDRIPEGADNHRVPRAVPSSVRQRGFTLLELLIVVAILVIVGAIGVPNYLGAVKAAKVGKARHELVTLAGAIDSYRTIYGRLPRTLYQVGFGGTTDPWGTPYCYLNYVACSGDGLDWAVESGLVDPASFDSFEAAADGSAGDAAERLALQALERKYAGAGFYTGASADSTRRRDRYMFPLNTDYDLFSSGPDARTATSLGEQVGLDDVVRANNGGYFGNGEDY